MRETQYAGDHDHPSADVTPGKMDLDGNKTPGGVPGIPFTVKYCCWLPDQDSNLEPTD